MHLENAVFLANVTEPNPVVNGLGAQVQLLRQLRDGQVLAFVLDLTVSFVLSRLILAQTPCADS